MKKSLGILVFGMLAMGLFAGKVDSLQQLLLKKNGQSEAFLWSEIGYAYEQQGLPDSAMSAYARCLACAEKDVEPNWQGRCLRFTGLLLQSQYQYDRATDYFERAIRVFELADSLIF